MEKEIKFIRFTILKLVKVFEDKDVASLAWGIRMGYPRITVFTSNDKSMPIFNRMVTAPFDIVTFQMFCNMLIDVVNYSKGESRYIECLNNKYVNGERTNEIYVQAKVVVGKDDKGINYLAVLEDGKKKVKFELLPGNYHRFFNKDKNLIEDKELLSNEFTKAYAELVNKLVYPEVFKDAVAIVPTGKPKVTNDNKELNIEDELGLS